MNTLSCALKYLPKITCDSQIRAIIEIRDIFNQWSNPSQLTTVSPAPKLKLKDRIHQHKTRILLTPPPPRVTKPTPAAQSPRVHFPEVAALTPRLETSTPRVETSHSSRHICQNLFSGVHGPINPHSYQFPPSPYHDARAHTQLISFPRNTPLDDVNRAAFSQTGQLL